jgi:hypothetical protein
MHPDSPQSGSSGEASATASALSTWRNAAASPPRRRQVDTKLVARTCGASLSRNSGKRFKANDVSCAHRTEAFGTISVVTKLENGKKIRWRCKTAAPSLGSGLDFLLGAVRQIGCDGLCHVTVRRAGHE